MMMRHDPNNQTGSALIAPIAGEKRCYTCKQTLPLTAFYRNRTKGDGYQARCIECTKQWRGQNKGEINRYQRDYRLRIARAGGAVLGEPFTQNAVPETIINGEAYLITNQALTLLGVGYSGLRYIAKVQGWETLKIRTPYVSNLYRKSDVASYTTRAAGHIGARPLHETLNVPAHLLTTRQVAAMLPPPLNKAQQFVLHCAHADELPTTPGPKWRNGRTTLLVRRADALALLAAHCKQCTHCGKLRWRKRDYHRNRSTYDGYQYWCKDCVKTEYEQDREHRIQQTVANLNRRLELNRGWVTSIEAARRIGVSRERIRQYINEGKLQHRPNPHHARSVLVAVSDVANVIAARAANGNGKLPGRWGKDRLAASNT